MIIGIDLDGVIFNSRAPRLIFFLSKKINLSLLFSFFSRINFFRKNFYNRAIEVNQNMAWVMRKCKNKGWRVVIISGHPSSGRKEIKSWLKKYNIPYDKLCLSPNGRKPKRFKWRKILEYGCDFFIDDNWDIVKYLRKKLRHICIVYYEGYQELVSLTDKGDVV